MGSSGRVWRGLAAAAAAWLAVLGHGGRDALALDAGGREALVQVLRAADRGEWQWARRAAGDLGSRPLALYVRWRELLEAEPGFAAYADFLARNPDWPSLAAVRARAEARIDEEVSPADRLAFFARAPALTRQGRIRHAQALLATGREAEATELLRESWRVDPFPTDEADYFLGLYRQRLRPADHEARLDRLLWDGEIAAAQRLLPLVRKDLHPMATARIRLQGLERTADAAYAAVPQAQRTAHAGLMYDRLRWWRKRGKAEDGLPILLRLPADLARPELWWREQQLAIRDLVEEGDAARAYAVARVHRQREGVAFAEAEWLAGWIALRFLKDATAAKAHFERMWAGVGTPISRGRAAYWVGRAADFAGDRAGARAWYQRAAKFPATFYGQMGARKVGLKPAALVPPRVPASPAARDALRRRDSAAVAAALCRLGGAGGPAQPFFRHLGHAAAGDPDALRAVAELATTGCGRPDLAIAAAKAAAREGAEPDPYAVFPVPALKGLRAAGPALPDPALRLAVARQESQFDSGAASPAGALGMMQLMPATAQAVSGRLGLPYSRTRLVRDADYNVRLGSTYLQQQLDNYDQEAALALAAYNAGPGRVARWLGENGDPRGGSAERLVDWVEMIPFAETRNYVQRVLEAREVYGALLARERRGSPAREAAAAPAGAPRPAS